MRRKVLTLVAGLAVCASAAAAQSRKELGPAVQWVAAQGGAVPSGALPTGFDESGFLYSCRASIEGGTHPGKVKPGLTGCIVPIGGEEQSVRNYEVMVGPPQRWAAAQDGQVPDRAIDVGRTRQSQPLYVCRAVRRGEYVPGRLGAGLSGCSIGASGRENTIAIYEVLVR